MGLVSRHTVKYHRVGPVHLYEVALFTREGELARMNKGEYCAETRVLVVAPDHCILAIDNDAISESHDVEPDFFGFDPTCPDSPEVLQAIGNNIAAGAEEDWADSMPLGTGT